MRKLFKKTMALVLTSAMAITGAVSFAPGNANTTKAADTANPVYKAYTAFQVGGSWASRANWADSTAGLNGGIDYTVKDVGTTGNNVTYNYLKNILVYNSDATDHVIDAGIKDAEIKDNGTYTMEMTNLPLAGLAGMSESDAQWNTLSICTDIPVTETAVKCTDLKVYFDDSTTPFATLAEAPYNKESSTNNGVLDFFIFDNYSSTHQTTGVLNHLLTSYKKFPTKSMKIEFTISGIDFGKEKQEVVVDNGLMVGQTFTDGNFKYKVLTRSKTDGTKGTVSIAGTSTTGAKKTSLTTVATATNSTNKYDVTAIAAKAFQSNKKLKKIKLGSSITKIGSSAFLKCTKLTGITYNKKVTSVAASTFQGCTSLSKITLGSKVKSIGKSAFKGCKKLAKISISQKVKVTKGAFTGCKKTIKVSGAKAKKTYTVSQIKKSGYKKVK